MNLRDEITKYSKSAYLAEHFAQCTCAECGSTVFEVIFDEIEGVAGRRCTQCQSEHWIGDSEQYLAEVEEFDKAICTCDNEQFEVMVGVALYRGSDDVKWFYLGCRCTQCGLAGVYADWKTSSWTIANSFN